MTHPITFAGEVKICQLLRFWIDGSQGLNTRSCWIWPNDVPTAAVDGLICIVPSMLDGTMHRTIHAGIFSQFKLCYYCQVWTVWRRVFLQRYVCVCVYVRVVYVLRDPSGLHPIYLFVPPSQNWHYDCDHVMCNLQTSFELINQEQKTAKSSNFLVARVTGDAVLGQKVTRSAYFCTSNCKHLSLVRYIVYLL